MFRFADGMDDYSRESVEKLAEENGITPEEAQKTADRIKARTDYLEPMVSKNLAGALGKTDQQDFYARHCRAGLFEGMGQWFALEDEDFGHQMIAKKIARMQEKLLDRKTVYPFDVFENWIFRNFLEDVGEEYSDPAKEKEIRDTLVGWLGENEIYAMRMAAAVTRLAPMRPGYFEDESGNPAELNPFFADNDYVCFDVYDFETCIHSIALLYSQGYGDEYAKRMFTDIGMTPSILLIGTREGNKARERYMSRLREAVLTGESIREYSQMNCNTFIIRPEDL